MTTTNIKRNFYTEGYEGGTIAAHGWPVTQDEARRYINGMDTDGDLTAPAPLSGEWAGESLPEIMGEYADNEDAILAYEQGFDAGWEDTLTARCHDMNI